MGTRHYATLASLGSKQSHGEKALIFQKSVTSRKTIILPKKRFFLSKRRHFAKRASPKRHFPYFITSQRSLTLGVTYWPSDVFSRSDAFLANRCIGKMTHLRGLRRNGSCGEVTNWLSGALANWFWKKISLYHGNFRRLKLLSVDTESKAILFYSQKNSLLKYTWFPFSYKKPSFKHRSSGAM